MNPLTAFLAGLAIGSFAGLVLASLCVTAREDAPPPPRDGHLYFKIVNGEVVLMSSHTETVAKKLRLREPS